MKTVDALSVEDYRREFPVVTTTPINVIGSGPTRMLNLVRAVPAEIHFHINSLSFP